MLGSPIVVLASCGDGWPDPAATSCFSLKWLHLTVCGTLVPSVTCCVPQVRPGCATGTHEPPWLNTVKIYFLFTLLVPRESAGCPAPHLTQRLG